MTFQLDCRSDFYDVKEAIGNSLANRITFDVDALTITTHDEDAETEVQVALEDLGIDTREHIPGEDMDGDHDSAMESAGFGYDEQYEHGTFNED